MFQTRLSKLEDAYKCYIDRLTLALDQGDTDNAATCRRNLDNLKVSITKELGL